MKVCLINNLYKPYSRGGAERVAEMTASGLRERGHEVFVITAAPNPRSEKFEFHPNDPNDELGGRSAGKGSLKIYHVYSPNLAFYGNLGKLTVPLLRLIWHFLDMFNIWTAWKIRKIVDREKPDTIFLHNLKGLSYLISKFLRKRNLILILHDTQLAMPSGVIFYNEAISPISNSREWVNRVYQKINRFLFSNIKKVIFPSKWLLEFYASYGFFREANQIVLHNPAPDISNSRVQIVDFKNQQLKLLFVGQLEKSKGILFLVKTLKNVTHNQQPITYNLTIVGDGSKRQEVERLVARDSRFQYLGRLGGEALRKVYGEADFTVVPSLVYENCPTVILESFAAGTPVIAARIGGIPELVSDGQNGFLLEPGSDESLAQILNNINKNNWANLNQQCKIKAEAHELDRYINLLINFVHEEDKQNALERKHCKMCE